MFDHIKCTNNTLVKKICCRDYHKQIKTPEINEGTYVYISRLTKMFHYGL